MGEIKVKEDRGTQEKWKEDRGDGNKRREMERRGGEG